MSRVSVFDSSIAYLGLMLFLLPRMFLGFLVLLSLLLLLLWLMLLLWWWWWWWLW